MVATLCFLFFNPDLTGFQDFDSQGMLKQVSLFYVRSLCIKKKFFQNWKEFNKIVLGLQ